MKSKQSTFGDVRVNNYKGERRCDKGLFKDESGHICRCKNTAKIALIRPFNDVAEFYCGMHAKDEWETMADEQDT